MAMSSDNGFISFNSSFERPFPLKVKVFRKPLAVRSKKPLDKMKIVNEKKRNNPPIKKEVLI